MTDMAVALDPDKLETFHEALMSKGQEEANAAAAAERDRDRRLREQLYQENRVLWVHHHYCLAESFAKLSADHARRARALEEQT